MISALSQARHVKDLGEYSAQAPADINLPGTGSICTGSGTAAHGGGGPAASGIEAYRIAGQ